MLKCSVRITLWSILFEDIQGIRQQKVLNEEGYMNKRLKRIMALALAVSLTAGSIWQGAGDMQIQAAEPDLTDGLVGYWTFEGETEAERLAGSAPAANVSAAKTGNGVTLNGSGGVGGSGAASFSGDNNSYLTLNLADADLGLNTSNAFTIGAWIKYETLPANGTSVFHQDGSGSGRAILTLGNSGQYGTYLDASNRYCSQTIQREEWHHVMLAVDAADVSPRKAYFYLDGVQTNGETLTGTLVNGSGNIRVGTHRENANSSAITGIMDELRYYSKALNADSVKAIYDLHSGILEAQGAKERLDKLIASAKALNADGTDEEAVNLQAAIRKAEGVRDDASADIAAVEDVIAELQSAVRAYEAKTPITIEVDTSQTVREIPSAMFGINHRYHNYGYGSWDNENDKINDDFNARNRIWHPLPVR